MSGQQLLTRTIHWDPRRLSAILGLLVCAVALIPLWQVPKNFQTDWDNHLWTVEFYGRYLKENHAAPDVLNTPQAVGLACPVFYASKFYTFLGLLSIPFGSALAFRLFAFGLLLAQWLHVSRAVKSVCPFPALQFVVTSATVLSVFHLITLYERGDLPEFSAFSLLTMAVCTLFVLVVRTARREPDAYGLVATGFLYGTAACIHPLTALFGGLTIAALGTTAWLATRRLRLLVYGLATSVALCSLLGAWLYVVVRFGRQVRIADRVSNYGSFEGSCVTSPLEMLISGFKPWAFHPFSSVVDAQAGLFRMDIQLALALLIVCTGAIILWRRYPTRENRTHRLQCSLLGCSYTLLLVSLVIFCSPAVSASLGKLFDVMQFPYRIAAYIDLLLLTCALSLFGLIEWPHVQKSACARGACTLMTWNSFLIVALGFGSKVAQIELDPHYGAGETAAFRLLEARGWPASIYRSWVPGLFGRDALCLANLPALYFWLCDYEVTAGFPNVLNGTVEPLLAGARAKVVLFAVGPVWGTTAPAEIFVSRPSLVVTNVSAFPWNALTLDGVRVSPADTYAVQTAYPIPKIKPRHLAIIIGPGQHVLSYQFVPDRLWSVLSEVSWAAFFVWAAIWLTVAVKLGVNRIEARETPF